MHIAYVGPFSYPSSNANSLRVQGVAAALVQGGHEVTICPGLTSTEPVPNTQRLDNITIHQIDEYKKGLGSMISTGARGLFLGDITAQWLKSLPKKPDAVLLYGTHLGYLLRLLKYCRNELTPLLLDIVEWYDPRHLPGGPLGPFSLSNELSMRWVAPQANGHLVISSYLEDYYRTKGCRTLRIPPLFSEFPARPSQLREKNGVLNICYAGTVGKKENFTVLLHGIQHALDAGTRLKFHIIGPTESDFLAKFPGASAIAAKYNRSLIFHGPMTNQATRQLVATSDFLMLARPSLRFANAGFPFKIAESMSLGTPVITNRFSDIPRYLKDEENSFLIPSLSAEGISACIRKAASLNQTTRTLMQSHAAQTAREVFSATASALNLSQFIQGSFAAANIQSKNRPSHASGHE